MSAGNDFDDIVRTESSISECDCHRRFSCSCKMKEEDVLVTPSTKILLGEIIGCGRFSTIRIGVDLNTGDHCAVKLAPRIDWRRAERWDALTSGEKETVWLNRLDDDKLFGEFKSYHLLSSVKNEKRSRSYLNLPVIGELGFCKDVAYMTMDLLGPDLFDLFVVCKYHFTLKTVLQIAIQLTRTLKYVHDCGVLHRDIKPDNCLIGRKATRTDSVIYLVDFGDSRELICRRRNAHIRPKIGLPIHGNARFASLNTHLGKELSRRDDLESLCYMLIYFLKGYLPWQGLEANDSAEFWSRVSDTKRITPISNLCEGLPTVFLDFLRRIKRLQFFETPEYDFWIDRFIDLYRKNEFSDPHQFDWSEYENF